MLYVCILQQINGCLQHTATLLLASQQIKLKAGIKAVKSKQKAISKNAGYKCLILLQK
jgi:hypothetical protein